jgi:hypothetical protein
MPLFQDLVGRYLVVDLGVAYPSPPLGTLSNERKEAFAPGTQKSRISEGTRKVLLVLPIPALHMAAKGSPSPILWPMAKCHSMEREGYFRLI